MPLALIADVHANLDALDACLRDARARGADRLAFLGDLVGYGAEPRAVLERVARAHEAGAVVVRGNHDTAVDGTAGFLNEPAARAIEWTRRVLGAQDRRWLQALPLVVREPSTCFVHASAARPERWDYIDAPGPAAESVAAAATPYVFCGHIHVPALYYEVAPGRMRAFSPTPGSPVPVRGRRRWLAIPGSAGQPRDGSPAAAYALFDERREELTFHRVAYDHRRAAARVRDAGLPEILAYRLERGA